MARCTPVRVRTATRHPAALVIVTWAIVALAAGVSADGGPDVTVTETAGVYAVTAQFEVDQPVSAVLAVLTDYERIPTYAPGVQLSQVLERHGPLAIVEQEATARVLLFSKRIHLILEVEESETALAFRDRCGQSFALYEGAWLVEPHEDRTRVTYQLTARPAFSVPGFLLERLLRRDARQMLERLQDEIANRA